MSGLTPILVVVNYFWRPGWPVLLLAGIVLAGCPATLRANPGLYEPGSDPGLGFNLVSWANFASGNQIWEDAVDAVAAAGFDEVSLSPIRFFNPATGAIASTSNSGPELAHVAAGVARAKQLGMRVTVNPFVEPAGFTEWRGRYDPAPQSAAWQTFWGDYEAYLVDVAQMAAASGADSMTVGTELRALTRNPGNNASWISVINAVDNAFDGTLGYAANWDNYNHPNLAATIWDHPSIDYLGIDAYFTNLVAPQEADESGIYPNAAFIDKMETAWNDRLDNEILPFAATQQGGAGLPVKFTEVGYLPRNQTTVTPQGESQSFDADEQNMAYEGLLRALDGRQASGQFLATHIWQWDMPGSGGSLWNMNPAGGNQPANQQTAAWLSNFASGLLPDPGDPPLEPPGATQILYSFENGLQNFVYPDFDAEPATMLAQASSIGATHGNHSLAVEKPTSPWTWDAQVQMTGTELAALKAAVDRGVEDFSLELDVTYVADELPAELSHLDLHVSLQTTPGHVWTQAFPFAGISGPVDQTFRVQIPLTSFDPAEGLAGPIDGATLHLGFSGNWNVGPATIYVDRIGLYDRTAVNPDFNGDDLIDSLDLAQWQSDYGQGSGSDANGDQRTTGLDLLIWQRGLGRDLTIAATQPIPEPTAVVLLLTAIGASRLGGWRLEGCERGGAAVAQGGLGACVRNPRKT